MQKSAKRLMETQSRTAKLIVLDLRVVGRTGGGKGYSEWILVSSYWPYAHWHCISDNIALKRIA